MSNGEHNFYYLGAALAIGLLIGLERGWHARDAQEGERIAGLRTYGLIGLLGGASGLLAENLGPWAAAVALISLAGVLMTAYIVSLQREADLGITSLVAGLLTFVLGALAVFGELAIAAATAVVTTTILGYKPLLHSWVRALREQELYAGLKFLLISVVVLPILPNRGYGPWQALNPYAIWWMVVLIAAISFVGYFAIRIGGARKGVLFTGLFGGLASSTAVTLHFSRLAGDDPRSAAILSSGILLSCATMLPRMLLLASALNIALFRPLVIPATVMALLMLLPALFYLKSTPTGSSEVGSVLKNPLELKPAIGFGLLLALVLLLGNALRHWFGDSGVLFLAAASGITDVDAITLFLARSSADGLTGSIASIGLVVAALTNSLTKGVIAAAMGGRQTALRVTLPLVVASLGGLSAVLLWPA